MKTRSGKNKGVRLQNWVRDILRELHMGSLEDDDIKGAVMGQTGADIILSPAARKEIPWDIECKNQEVFKGMYKMYGQATANTSDGRIPALIIKMNREKPLIVLDAEDYFRRS